VCLWTVRLFALPFFVLLLVGCALETVGGQAGFMARPATLLTFGVMMLGLGVGILGWYRTWADAAWRREQARAGRRVAEEADWQAPRWRRVHAASFGVFCVVNGLALLAAGAYRL
jgi:hypothetical protein